MAKKKDSKNLITGIVAAVVAVALIAVIVVVVVMSSKKLDDSFFVSDDTKYVLTLSSSDGIFSLDVDKYTPEKAHIVYFYSGDEITGVNVYYEYESDAVAKDAVEYFNGQDIVESEIEKIETDGKYVVVKATSEVYEGMTAEDASNKLKL